MKMLPKKAIRFYPDISHWTRGGRREDQAKDNQRWMKTDPWQRTPENVAN
jgi:hypothetical protein